MSPRTRQKKTRLKAATEAAKKSPARMRCEWCGNLVAAHTRELLAACRSHARQLWSGGGVA